MARRVSIDVSDVIAKRPQLEKLMAETVLTATQKLTIDIGNRLTVASPVDTGFFRGSWEINVPTKPYQAGSVENNTVYATTLAKGHSPQADDGWVENCVVAAVKFGGFK